MHVLLVQYTTGITIKCMNYSGTVYSNDDDNDKMHVTPQHNGTVNKRRAILTSSSKQKCRAKKQLLYKVADQF